MTTLLTAIVSSAFALVAGMLSSKVYFATRVMKNSVSRDIHDKTLEKHVKHEQDKLSAMQNKARLKISSLNQKIEEKDREIVRLLSDACSKETVADSSLRKLIEIQRTEIATLLENLQTRDGRIQVLNSKLSHTAATPSNAVLRPNRTPVRTA